MLHAIWQLQSWGVRVKGRVVAATPGNRGQGTIKWQYLDLHNEAVMSNCLMMMMMMMNVQ